MQLTAKHTLRTSYIGYLTQAIVINFCPLLFVNFVSNYGISLTKISFIVGINFITQLFADYLIARVSGKINIRATLITAHALAAGGLLLLGILPDALPDPYIGLIIATVISSAGSGIIEVLVSPVVEACPTTEKSANMSLLHSFYSWGFAGMVLVSALFFMVFGIENWKFLAFFWALVPLTGGICYAFVPLYPIAGEEGKSSAKALFTNKFFLVMIIIIFAAGAAETTMSQWASSFAETGLGISKTLGDLLGPFIFALLMGLTRVFYAKFSRKIKLVPFYIFSTLLCIVAYLLVALTPGSVFALVGCALCGISVGVMWPGVYSLSAQKIPLGGVGMYAFLAMAGDLGCTAGPILTGAIADSAAGNLRPAFLFSVIFPALILLAFGGLFLAERKKKSVIK